MSRNLCRDFCPDCGPETKIKLSDLVGKPIEFRKYGRYSPTIGTKWICPKCGKVYFCHFRKFDTFWGELAEQFDKPTLNFGVPGHTREPNHHQGKFAIRIEGVAHETGCYEFDLSYYETYNDEGEGKDTEHPSWLCTKDDPFTRRET